ncbi:MAG: septum site-determining protein MinC [Chitinophagales bacterium]
MSQGLVTFKGSRQGITLVLDGQAPFETVLADLTDKLAKAGDFFKGAPVSVACERVLEPAEASSLVRILCDEHQLKLAGVTGATAAAAPSAAEAAAARPGRSRRQAGEAEGGDREAALLVRRTVRSGQRIAFDGHVVVMGDVNPGGEVVATGDIVVWGTLRGTAHAGAGGRLDATVTALRLMPTQLRIAHLITRAPDGKAAVPKAPEVARVKGEAVVVEAFAS